MSGITVNFQTRQSDRGTDRQSRYFEETQFTLRVRMTTNWIALQTFIYYFFAPQNAQWFFTGTRYNRRRTIEFPIVFSAQTNKLMIEPTIRCHRNVAVVAICERRWLILINEFIFACCFFATFFCIFPKIAKLKHIQIMYRFPTK